MFNIETFEENECFIHSYQFCVILRENFWLTNLHRVIVSKILKKNNESITAYISNLDSIRIESDPFERKYHTEYNNEDFTFRGSFQQKETEIKHNYFRLRLTLLQTNNYLIKIPNYSFPTISRRDEWFHGVNAIPHFISGNLRSAWIIFANHTQHQNAHILRHKHTHTHKRPLLVSLNTCPFGARARRNASQLQSRHAHITMDLLRNNHILDGWGYTQRAHSKQTHTHNAPHNQLRNCG